MAGEEEGIKEKIEKKKENLWKRFKNFLKYNIYEGTNGRIELKEEEVEGWQLNIEEKLRKEGVVQEFKDMVGLVDKIEKKWAAFVKSREGLFELYKRVGFIRHSPVAYLEAGFAKFGTDPTKIGTFKKEELDVDKVSFEPHKQEIFSMKIRDKTVEFPVPAEVPIKFWGSLINDRDALAEEHKIGYFGFMNDNPWKTRYNEIIGSVINEAKQELIKKYDKIIIETNLSTIESQFNEILGLIFGFLNDRENQIFGHCKEIGNQSDTLENMRNTIIAGRPDSVVNVRFRRSFKVINPELIMQARDYRRMKELENKYGFEYDERDNRKNEENTNKIKRIRGSLMRERKVTDEEKFNELRRLLELWGIYHNKIKWKDIGGKGEGEEVPGLDMNGWPLEVADENYEYNGRRIREGAVLIDIFEDRGKKRRVDKKWIEDMDLLLVANIIHNEWDAVRDDVRDGRYHLNSLTVIDYLMAKGAKFDYEKGEFEWERASEEQLEDENFRERFRKYFMLYWKGGADTRANYEAHRGVRRPTNLIPTFDKKFLKKSGKVEEKWVHLGRKYYYDPADRITDLTAEEKEREDIRSAIGPTISSRGISMYLIMDVLFRTKTYAEARRKLVEMAEGQWFDYGPRVSGGEFGEGPFDPLNLSKTLREASAGVKGAAREAARQ